MRMAIFSAALCCRISVCVYVKICVLHENLTMTSVPTITSVTPPPYIKAVQLIIVCFKVSRQNLPTLHVLLLHVPWLK